MEYRVAWPPFTRNVKITVIGLAVIFLATVLSGALNNLVAEYMLVSGPQVFGRGYVWTVFTYAFFHADFGHILFNCLALWMFAGELDQAWSSRKFWTVSLLSALGGGVVVALSQLIFGAASPTLGYSGAVMGLIAAFCWYNWQRRINFFFFPMTGRTLLMVIVGLDLLRVIIGGEPISIAGHLGGMATGLLLVGDFWRPRRIKQRWQRRSMKKKFRDATREVDRKRNGEWIN
jgi:membrane associated rhomboid family serine protease